MLLTNKGCTSKGSTWRLTGLDSGKMSQIPLTNKKCTSRGSTWRRLGLDSGKVGQDTAHKQEVHQQRLHLEADRAGLT